MRLGVFFPFDLALVFLLVFLFLVFGEQLLEEPLGLVQLDKDEEDDEAGQRFHCVVKARELHNTMNQLEENIRSWTIIPVYCKADSI